MSSKTGRRPRAETAELIRRSAVRLLQERGLRGFANSVRLDDALALLEEEQGIRLTHGSVYGRIWSDQRDFQLDVVSATIGAYDGSEIAAAIVERPTGRRRSPASGWEQLAATFARATVAARASRPWNLWLGARTAVVSTPEQDDDERLAAALGAAHDQVVASVVEALDTVLGPVPVPSPNPAPASATGGDGDDASVARAMAFVSLLVAASLTADERTVADTSAGLLHGLAWAVAEQR